MQKQLDNDYFNSISKTLDDDFYDVLLYSVNNILYNYSDHLVTNKNRQKGDVISSLKKIILKFIVFCLTLKNVLLRRGNKGTAVMSNAYVDLSLYGVNVVRPPWAFSPKYRNATSMKIFHITENIKKTLEERSIKLLLSKEFKLLLSEYEKEFTRLIIDYNIAAIIVPNDMAFFENFAIKIAKKKLCSIFCLLAWITRAL